MNNKNKKQKTVKKTSQYKLPLMLPRDKMKISKELKDSLIYC